MGSRGAAAARPNRRGAVEIARGGVPIKRTEKKNGRPKHADVAAARKGGEKAYDKDKMREARDRVLKGELTVP